MASGKEEVSETMRKRTKRMADDEQYFVEAIIGGRTKADGEWEYLVKWEGYPAEEASWEPADNINEEDITQWRESNSSLEEMADDERVVEAIIRERTNAEGDSEFLVKWKGYPVEEANWEPADNIDEDDIAQWDEDNPSSDDMDGVDVPVSENLVQATSGEGLPLQGPDSIIGIDETRYLVLQGPYPHTGEPRKPAWLLRALVARDRVREWEQLRQTLVDALNNLLKTDDYKSSYGAMFFAQYEYRRIERHAHRALFITKRSEAGTDTLAALLASIGIVPDPPVIMSEYVPESRPRNDSAASESLGDLEQEPHPRHPNDDDDEAEVDVAGDKDMVSNPKHPSAHAARRDKCTNDSRIDTANASDPNQATATQELAVLEDASSEADAEWVVDEDIYPPYVSKDDWARQQWESPSLLPIDADIDVGDQGNP